MIDKNNRVMFPVSIKDLSMRPSSFMDKDEGLLQLRGIYLDWAHDDSNGLVERMRYIRSVIVIDKELKKLESQ